MKDPKVLLITGTDTGVGKTIVIAALAVCLARSKTVAVLKLAQTGLGTNEAGDIDEVRRLSGQAALYEGVRLRDPLAPTTAARRQGVSVPTVAEHAKTIHDLGQTHDVVLVEGAGGLLVGIDGAGHGLRELAGYLEVPFSFLIVARPGLGTLNHTSLTVEALRSRGLPILGLVVGAYPASPDVAEQSNLDDLPLVTGVRIMGRVPEGVGSLPDREFQALAPTWLHAPLGDA